MRITRQGPGRWALVALSLTMLAGCGAPGSTDPGVDAQLHVEEVAGVAFMTQNVVPDEMMEARYEGRVVLADDGCLRLDTPDAHTVVWPRGYTLRAEDGELGVLDEDGAETGVGGESFTLGGGEVTVLLASLGFTDADRERAGERCPGRYWIVG